MKLIGNYSEDIRELIQGGEGRQYSIPGDIFVPEGSLETLPSSPPDGYNPATGNVLIGTLSPQEQWIWNGGAWGENPNYDPSDYQSFSDYLPSGDNAHLTPIQETG